MSRYDDDDSNVHLRQHSSMHRSSSRRRSRSPSPGRGYSTAAGLAPSYTASNAFPYDDDLPPRTSNPELGRHNSGALQVPVGDHHRPRSQPPRLPGTRDGDSIQGWSRSRSSSRSRSPSPTPHNARLGKAKHAVHNAFSASPSGIGAGVIGAVVGGLAAREASEAAARARDKKHGGHGHSSHDSHGSHKSSSFPDHRTTLISTLVGAAVVGLGANALEKHMEHRRRDREEPAEVSRALTYKQSSRSRSRGRDRGRDGGRDRDRGWDRNRSRGFVSDDDGYDDPSGYDTGSDDGRRDRRRRNRDRDRDRRVVISRSPSASASHSPSRHHGDGGNAPSNDGIVRPKHGGSADAYYNASAVSGPTGRREGYQ